MTNLIKINNKICKSTLSQNCLWTARNSHLTKHPKFLFLPQTRNGLIPFNLFLQCLRSKKKTFSKTTKPVSPTPITSASNIQAPSNASIISTNDVTSEHLLPIPTNNKEKWKKENNLKTTNKNKRKMMSSKHIDTTSSDSNQKLLPVPNDVKKTKTEKPKESTSAAKQDE